MGVIDVATVARGNTDIETGGFDRRWGRVAELQVAGVDTWEVKNKIKFHKK